MDLLKGQTSSGKKSGKSALEVSVQAAGFTLDTEITKKEQAICVA